MISCGLIGCGRISARHIWAMAQCSHNLRLTHLCDLDLNKSEAAKEKYNQLLAQKGIDPLPIKISDNFRDMLAEPPDVIVVATDSGSHYTLGMAVLGSKVNLLVEKPMAMSTVQCDLMIRLAQQNEVTLGVCHQNRFNKWVKLLKSSIDSGRFKILYNGAANLRWNRDESYYKQASWRGKYESDGGVLMNQAIHNLDLLRWLMGGQVEEVFGYTANLSHPYIEVEDLAVGVIKFTNNSYATIEATTNIYPKNYEETLSIFGKSGSVSLGGEALEEIKHWEFDDEVPPPPLNQKAHNEGIYGEGHLPLYEDFIASVINKTQPLCNGKEGRDSVELVTALYTSAKQHRRVRLHPALERY